MERVLVTVYGHDCKGITAGLTRILAEHHVHLVNIDQAALHGRLSMYLLLGIDEGGSGDGGSSFDTVLKDLLYKAKQLNVDLDFALLTQEEYDKGRREQKKNLFAITCLGEAFDIEALAAVTEALSEHDLNIENIRKLGERNVNCIEIIACAKPEVRRKEVARALLPLQTRFSLDIAVQQESIYRRSKRLVVMDMDSTLIQVEVIDELAKLYGVGRQVSEITERAMNGELDFEASLRARVALLKGLKEDKLQEVYDAIPFTPGAKRLIQTLKRLGYKTAVLSGGFDFFTNRLKEELGLDIAHANRLEIADGVLTGGLEGEIITGYKKKELLKSIAKDLGIPRDQTIAIGDGANDLQMISAAGLGIAFNAKPTVREQADHHISSRLDSILYLLGIEDDELMQLPPSSEKPE